MLKFYVGRDINVVIDKGKVVDVDHPNPSNGDERCRGPATFGSAQFRANGKPLSVASVACKSCGLRGAVKAGAWEAA